MSCPQKKVLSARNLCYAGIVLIVVVFVALLSILYDSGNNSEIGHLTVREPKIRDHSTSEGGGNYLGGEVRVAPESREFVGGDTSNRERHLSQAIREARVAFARSLQTLGAKRTVEIWRREDEKATVVAYSIARPDVNEIGEISVLMATFLKGLENPERKQMQAELQRVYDYFLSFTNRYKVVHLHNQFDKKNQISLSAIDVDDLSQVKFGENGQIDVTADSRDSGGSMRVSKINTDGELDVGRDARYADIIRNSISR